jgi:hypothetical protein
VDRGTDDQNPDQPFGLGQFVVRLLLDVQEQNFHQDINIVDICIKSESYWNSGSFHFLYRLPFHSENNQVQ